MHSPSEILSQINGFFTGRNRQKSVDGSEASSDEDNNESNGLFSGSGKFRRRSEEVLRNNEAKAPKHNGAISSAANLVRRAKHDLKLNFKRLSFGDNTPPALPVRHFCTEIEEELPPPIPERKCSLENVLDKDFENHFKFHVLGTCPLPEPFTNCKKTYPSQTAKKSRIERPSFQPPPPPPPADNSSSTPSPVSPSTKFSLAPPLKKNGNSFLDPPWQPCNEGNGHDAKIDDVKNGFHSSHGDTNNDPNYDATECDFGFGKDSMGLNASSVNDLLQMDENQTEFCSTAQLTKVFQSAAFGNAADKCRDGGHAKVSSNGQLPSSNLQLPATRQQGEPSSPPLTRPLPAPPLSPSPSRPLPPPPLQQAQKRGFLVRLNSNQLPVDNIKSRETPPLLTFASQSPKNRNASDVKQNSNKPKVKAVTSSPLSSRPPRPLPLKPKPAELTPFNFASPKPEKQATGLEKPLPNTKLSNGFLRGSPDDVSIKNGNMTPTLSPSTIPSSTSLGSLTTAFSLTTSAERSPSLFKPPLPSSSQSISTSTSKPPPPSQNKPPRPPPPSILARPPSITETPLNSSPSPPPPPLPSPTLQTMALSHAPLPPPPSPSPLPLPELPPALKPNSSNLFVPINPASKTTTKSRALPPPPTSPPFDEACQSSKSNGRRRKRNGVVMGLKNGWGGREVFDPREEDGDPYDVVENTKM